MKAVPYSGDYAQAGTMPNFYENVQYLCDTINTL